MGQILLVRHGQASWGADDYDVLSDVGWEQGRLLGRALAARGIAPDVVVRGGMRRHRETWEGVRETTGWDDAEVDDGWDEFEFDLRRSRELVPVPWGEAEPTPEEFGAWFESTIARWTEGGHDADYAESFVVFAGRVEAALQRTAEAAGTGTALVVTSGGPVSWATSSLLGDELAQRLPLWRRLNSVCVNTGVTQVITGRRGLTLVGFNDHSHLIGDQITYR